MRIINDSIDWLSVKLNLGTITLAAITGSLILQILAGVATVTTIAYNAIRIFKELKNKKNGSN